MKNYLFLIIILTLLSSQNNDNDFYFEEIYFNESIITYYLNSFDINDGSSNIEIFNYAIRANNHSIYSANPDITLNFSMSIQSESLGYSTMEELISGSVDIIDLRHDLFISNTDLNNQVTQISGLDVNYYNFIPPSADVIDNIQTVILQTGKIPDGVYSISIQMIYEDVVQHTVNKFVEIYSPIQLDLVSPGGILSDTTETAIFETYPILQWSADYCPTCEYAIRVCEYVLENHSSFEEAINDVSSLPLNQNEDFYSLGTNTYTFQYPVANASDLIPGNLYVWQIKRSYETTMGEENAYSNIFVFKITSFDELGGDYNPNAEILTELFGSNLYNQYFGPSGELSGYTLTNNITVNGEDVPITELYQLLLSIQNGTTIITEIEVE
jgi:hypothetical protein